MHCINSSRLGKRLSAVGKQRFAIHRFVGSGRTMVAAKATDRPGAMKIPGPPCPQRPLQQLSYGGRERVESVLQSGRSRLGALVTVAGWSRSVRKQGGADALFSFVVLSDGSTSRTLQVVVHRSMDPERYDAELAKSGAGCSFRFTGELCESPAAGQEVELVVRDSAKGHAWTLLGACDGGKYPLAKKKHGREFLREIAHLRPRTYLIGAVARLRSQLSAATHRYFQDRGFVYVHAPLITTADCEGAGEMFQVTTLLGDGEVMKVPFKKGPQGKQLVDYRKDFFQKPAFLTVSGQLELESYCCALSDVYTFGPTFRAENSHTSRHLAEFWMIEPEMAFCDVHGLMACAEDYLKYCFTWALKNCADDMEWFEKNAAEGGGAAAGGGDASAGVPATAPASIPLRQRLQAVIDAPFKRLEYTEAIALLESAVANDGAKFETQPSWGMDMGSEHERYLTEKVFKGPVIVYNYPKALKSFYMRQNDDGKTVAAMDVLLPKVGEVIGGSQREERPEVLDKMIAEKGLTPEPYWWYRELRNYGSVPHSGFGLGLERLVMTCSDVDNIRDVIPFPRYPGHAEF